MRVLKEEGWALARTIIAICITVMALACLALAAGCTNDLTAITGNRGTGETLALGTLTTKDANKDANAAQTRTDAHTASPATRADSPLPDATAWQGFRTGDQLHVTIAAGEGNTLTRSSGLYEYTGNSETGTEPLGEGTWTASTPAYWQRADGNTLTLWRGPEADTTTPGAYDMPLTYETNTTQGYALNAWDGSTYTTDADKWRITDLLRYSSSDADLPTATTGMSTTRATLNLTLKHSMAQLCVELLPGEGMTAEELQTQATVHLKSAAANFIMQPDGRPAIYRFENEQNRQDVRLLKNGATSRMFYALMLPGQTFGTDRVMISIHIGGTHFNYTPKASLTATENTCHKLVLEVSRAEVSALSITATGWQNPTVITQPEESEVEGILVMNETPGDLKNNAALLNALKDATQDVPVNLIITGNINDTDLEELSALMKYTDTDNAKKFKVNSLIIYATGATTLPNFFAGNDDYATPNTVLKKVILPEGITNIEKEAFYSCENLTSITIPNKVTTIADGTFQYCYSLATVILPESLESIGNGAFYYCKNLTDINIPAKVTTIADYTFQGCYNLVTVTLPENLESIGNGAFDRCASLTSITIPQTVTSIGNGAFRSCESLTSINIPDKVTTIAKSTFDGCSSLATITLPENLESIGNDAFNTCIGLRSIIIPDKVTTIGNNTFKNCSNLANVTLPESLESIGNQAFKECKSLTSITIPDKVTTIADGTFYNCGSLVNVTLPENLESIGNDAFSDCINLTSIIIPDKVTTIGSNTFGATSLANVTLPENLESIGNYAFNYCSSLTSINIPDKVTTIADGIFWNCSSLVTAVLPENLKSIGEYAFGCCSLLKNLVYKGTTLPDITLVRPFLANYNLNTLFLPKNTSFTGESLTWLGQTWRNIYCNAKGGTDMNSIEALTNTDNYQGSNIGQ